MGIGSVLCASQVTEFAPLDAGDVRPQPIREEREAAPGRIDVKPDPFRATQIRQGGQRIDRTGRGGPRRADDAERDLSGCAIASDLLSEIVDVEPLPRVAPHAAERSLAEAGCARDLDERIVRLIGRVQHGTPGEAHEPVTRVVGKRRRQGQEDTSQVGLGPTGGEHGGGVRLDEAEPAREIREGVPLDLARRRRVPPRGDLRVVEGRQRISDHPGTPDTRDEQAEVARMRRVQPSAFEQIDDLRDQGAEVVRLREIVRRDPWSRASAESTGVTRASRTSTGHCEDAFGQDRQRVHRRSSCTVLDSGTIE